MPENVGINRKQFLKVVVNGIDLILIEGNNVENLVYQGSRRRSPLQ
jgi:hypothetical protein